MSAGDGNGWVVLPDGSRRWGLYGASGLLLHAHDTAGTGHVLLQHRAWWTHQGNTWGMPGGARDSEESSVAAALREFGEEVTGDLGGVAFGGIHRQDHVVWSYDTVLGRIPERRVFTPGNSESAAIRWVPVDEVGSMPLLPAFGLIWPQVRAALAQRLVLVVDAANAVGHRPDGWWRDRPGAAARLRDELAGLAGTGLDGAELPAGLALTSLHRWFPRILMVVEGAARETASVPGVEVVEAPGEGDDTVAELAGLHAGASCALVVTADRELGDRCRAAGASVASPSWLLSAAAAADPANR
ncbi:8-oxo-dGTP pyrophosphatase MutT (NUDIX family) [Spinactinospora alkalitolerans]|uniref:8-oxo-dGTP pyrophosphatase MutT (NUDIX family) n=1 Tax=Spinactinospora alkalitolerans TaxID=687207 RepID=A0A852U5L1_9ACTN|nr:NUDIX hydrolase [Spinactinospora alkalitolerans]NYE50907.1 8-oxo-dGTP pyrophosphatase MutT (NUDIX family) [Spinactinospora alkalitolerans]